MSDNTSIEWCDSTWNPVTGCTEVSPGCDRCYAKTFAERWRGTPGHYFEHGFDVQLRHDKLDQPLRWRKPRRIFVNSMSDLFHDQVPDEYIGSVFDVMARAEQHTFQILTKRHARMRSLLRKWEQEGADSVDRGELHPDYGHAAWRRHDKAWCTPRKWPLPNVWLGVSTENQQWADIRIPALLDTPAAVRFISAEPLLGPIDLYTEPTGAAPFWGRHLDWVIVGGESGPGARPMHHDWVTCLLRQCQDSDTPFLFKQWGNWSSNLDLVESLGKRDSRHTMVCTDGRIVSSESKIPEGSWLHIWNVGKAKAGRELLGRTWDQYPEVGAA
ncbi:DUF5131 family protein [Mycolicibacterium fortuitum]|uniref:DUF5131 family protein n=1 Tax=Mycolicibacterium fortuitum TaxID=1766 RepID=UPI0007EAF451|nr:phage Gp37/Gp68 family protein [Mycolicibacterium fortuitum]OBB46106.1 hypothetical protein A5754_09030 [Mycolicibacterium fortuitum]OBB53535.1 hypothetical protein A5755_32340 [Mycolicibacterium fortuitum]OBF65297.1 hypothetical protein A5751_03995 [Mycolicibacterium fortuitum]